MQFEICVAFSSKQDLALCIFAPGALAMGGLTYETIYLFNIACLREHNLALRDLCCMFKEAPMAMGPRVAFIMKLSISLIFHF